MFGNANRARIEQIEHMQGTMAKINVKVYTIQQQQEYGIDLKLSGNPPLKFRMLILLPPDFPSFPPSIRVMADISHPLLNSRGEVVSEKLLLEWQGGRRKLGEVIMSILHAFKQQKPQPSNRGTVAQQPQPMPPSSGAPGTSETMTPEQEAANVPPEIGQLKNMAEGELKRLVEDQAAFDEWFGELPMVKQKTLELSSMMEQNAEMAGRTLSMEDEYNRLREQVKDLRDSFLAKKAAFEGKYQEQMARVQQASDSSSLMKELDTAIHDAEMASELTAEKFCDGDIPIGEFLKIFKEERVQYHTRNAKREMLMARQ